MSDDIISIATSYGDVAELAQGYLNRVDGERILLPLPTPCPEGSGVRYVVHLADGTPAFAGAGRCAQVSDQGDTVAPEHRFETLIDSLQFDERSQPVYDYMVAIRNQAYAQGAPEEAAAQVEDEDVAMVEEGEAVAEVAEVAADAFDDEPTAYAGAPSATETLDDLQPADAGAYDAGEYYEEPPAHVASIQPEAIPTGTLRRPARAVHWVPAPPRRPTPRPASGMFVYNGGGLPVPQRPPYPELDPGYFVQPAPHPRSAAAVAVAAPAHAELAEAYAEPAEAYAEPADADVEFDDVEPAEEPTVAADEDYGADAYEEPPTVIAEEGYEKQFQDSPDPAQVDIDLDADDEGQDEEEPQGW
jgi:hypothetical protein